MVIGSTRCCALAAGGGSPLTIGALCSEA